MKRMSWILAAEWLAGVAIYLAVSAAVSHVFVLVMLHWAHEGAVYRSTELEILFLRRPIFLICVCCGAFYSSALAKPNVFGGTSRILKHLGWSFLLIVLGCVLPIRIELLPLPDFQSMFFVSVYIVGGLVVSGLCFVAAIAAWVRVAFGRSRTLAKTTAER